MKQPRPAGIFLTGLFCLILTGVLTGNTGKFDPGPRPGQFFRDFGFLYREIRDNYVNLQYKEKRYQFKWDELFKLYLPKIKTIDNYRDFYKICTRFTGYLRDGHLRFRPRRPDIRSKILRHYDSVYHPFEIRMIENKGVVVGAYHGKLLGMEVHSINGIPLRQILTVLARHYYIGVNDTSVYARLLWREQYLDYFNLYGKNFPAQLVYVLKGRPGNKRTYVISSKRGTSGKNESLVTLRGMPLGMGGSRLPEFRLLRNKLGYIRIPTFAGSISRIVGEFSKAVSACRASRVKGVIMDIRYNGGGNESFRRILEFLTDRKIKMNFYRFRVRRRFKQILGEKRVEFENNRSPVHRDRPEPGYSRWWSWVLRPAGENFLTRIPVVVLYNYECFSSAIDFIVTCQQFKLAGIIGPVMETSTNGFTRPVMLPSKEFTIAYAMLEFRDLNFQYIEFIRPDLEMSQTISDLVRGRDTQLESAFRFLAGRHKFRD